MLNFTNLEDPKLDDRWLGLKSTGKLANPDKRDMFYQGSYRFILSHMATCTFDESKADCERFWQSLILIYSWMGRGLLSNFNDHLERYQKACMTLRSTRANGRMDQVELDPLLDLCNGRIVGASKLLHFVRPDRFAIWDSRVGSALFGKFSNAYQVNLPLNYLAYLDWIQLTALGASTEHEVAAYLGINATIASLRVKEFILFMTSTSSDPARD